MVTSQSPLGETIFFIHEHPDSVQKERVTVMVKKLVELIVDITPKKGVRQTALELTDIIFSLRLELLSDPGFFEELFNNVDRTIHQRIRSQYETKPTYIDLENAYVNSLSIYSKIASATLDSGKVALPDFQNEEKPTYTAFSQVLSVLPVRERDILLHYISSSLLLDYGFIVTELVFKSELKLRSDERRELINILKESIEVFGAYSEVLGLWTPEELDESSWMRNMKIVTSRIRTSLDTSSLTFVSSNDLKSALELK